MLDGLNLKAEKIQLRVLEESDFPSLVKLANNKAISANVLNIPYPYSEFNAIMRKSYITQGFNEKSKFVFAIALNDSNQFVGEISLHVKSQGLAECAYWIGEPYWNKAYASQALRVITIYGFKEWKLKTIFASCRSINKSSIRVLEKNGFSFLKSAGKVNYYKKDNENES
jgi:RimJ/RimL family protein N-acetyltransferase